MMVSPNPGTVALVGGGRWGRVLANELLRVLSANTEIIWVTRYGAQHARSVAGDRGAGRIRVVDDLAAAMLSEVAFVANRPSHHSATIRHLLEAGVHVMTEKPLGLDGKEVRELVRLAQASGLVVGVNLSFLCANYLSDFVSRCDGSDPSEVLIRWHDPWLSQRYGEVKRADRYTSIVHDMLPHCWSVLRAVMKDTSGLLVRTVEYNPHQTIIKGAWGETAVTISLGRRANQRLRSLTMRSERLDAEIDFSVEPGRSKVGTRVFEERWKGGRPLENSIRSFLSAVAQRDLAWALSAQNCLNSVDSAGVAFGKLLESQRQILLKSTHHDFDDPALVYSVVDFVAPTLGSDERQVRLDSFSEQQEAARNWIHRIN